MSRRAGDIYYYHEIWVREIEAAPKRSVVAYLWSSLRIPPAGRTNRWACNLKSPRRSYLERIEAVELWLELLLKLFNVTDMSETGFSAKKREPISVEGLVSDE